MDLRIVALSAIALIAIYTALLLLENIIDIGEAAAITVLLILTLLLLALTM